MTESREDVRPFGAGYASSSSWSTTGAAFPFFFGATSAACFAGAAFFGAAFFGAAFFGAAFFGAAFFADDFFAGAFLVAFAIDPSVDGPAAMVDRLDLARRIGVV